MTVKVLKCTWKQWEGKEVEVYWRYANGVDFVDEKLGRIFLRHGEYIVTKEDEE